MAKELYEGFKSWYDLEKAVWFECHQCQVCKTYFHGRKYLAHLNSKKHCQGKPHNKYLCPQIDNRYVCLLCFAAFKQHKLLITHYGSHDTFRFPPLGYPIDFVVKYTPESGKRSTVALLHSPDQGANRANSDQFNLYTDELIPAVLSATDPTKELFFRTMCPLKEFSDYTYVSGVVPYDKGLLVTQAFRDVKIFAGDGGKKYMSSLHCLKQLSTVTGTDRYHFTRICHNRNFLGVKLDMPYFT